MEAGSTCSHPASRPEHSNTNSFCNWVNYSRQVLPFVFTKKKVWKKKCGDLWSAQITINATAYGGRRVIPRQKESLGQFIQLQDPRNADDIGKSPIIYHLLDIRDATRLEAVGLSHQTSRFNSRTRSERPLLHSRYPAHINQPPRHQWLVEACEPDHQLFQVPSVNVSVITPNLLTATR